ncbi:MAG: OadG family protein [Ignavibacteriales bacterium]|nr:hypothetical protein [Ignavibacteriaceae bacterium]MCK6613948.1 OadG family protein [Ignavibacteriaceae bacterium]QOJ30308.1 MAG: OadG family protein [Ignavibacteriales bacterium]
MNYLLIAQQTSSKKIYEVMQQNDPVGIGMTVIGMSVVFIALIILYLFLVNVAKVIYRQRKEKDAVGAEVKKSKQQIDAEVNAAIAMALHLYMNELHDNEQTVLTINRMSKMYSPWSSKIYGLRQWPR